MMLRPVLGGGHFEHVGNAEQRLLGVPVGDHLEDGEVLQDAVHHVLLWQMLQLEDEVDHVFAHWAPVDLVEVAPALKSGSLRLHLLHHLLSEAANLGGHLDRNVFITLVSEMSIEFENLQRKMFACVQQFKKGLGMQSKCHEEMSNKSKWFLNARCNWTYVDCDCDSALLANFSFVEC